MGQIRLRLQRNHQAYRKLNFPCIAHPEMVGQDMVPNKTSGRLPSSAGFRLIVFALFYWLIAQLGWYFVLQPEGIASIWPVSGLALATLLRVGDKERYQYVAAILAANFLANITNGHTIYTALAFAAANTAEPVLGCWAFNRIAGRSEDFSTIKEIWGLGAAAICANALTAFLGAAVPALAFGAPYLAMWELWWVANGLGMLIVTPLIISWTAWKRKVLPLLTLPRLIEGAVILLLTLAVSLNIFGILPVVIPIANRPYTLFPVIIWMAIRFEAPGAAALMLCISYVFLANSMNHLGVFPWGETTLPHRLIQTQGYLIMLSAVSLIVAGTMSSLRNSEKLLREEKETLRESEIKYRQLFNNAKYIEESRKESENLYRTLFDKARDGILLMTAEGKLAEFNESFADMHGYTSAELAQLDISKLDVLQEKTLEEHAELRRRILTGEWLHFEVQHYHKDGHIILLEVLSSAIDIGGQQYFLAFHKDISKNKLIEEERRALEERLHRAEKMEALGSLAGGVAHDLNNILGVLMGYSELLIEKIPQGNTLRIYASNILKSTEKGAAIIQDLLTLARRGVTVAEVINLNVIVSNFLKSPVFEQLQAYHPRVAFRTELDQNLLNIKGSPIHLEKTLMNLVTNATEAVSGQGEVFIRTENRYIDRAIRSYDKVDEGDYVVLTVSDTGGGIRPVDLGKIFEPFYTKKAMGRSGTGLGLAIVWGTVKDHNGYIDVESEYGKGATFTLYFPVTREEAVDGLQKIPLEQYQGRGESILVVDDIAEQRDIAARILTRLGYEVQVVSGGEEAVDYLKTRKADLLVLDMSMDPGIDGLETYQRILQVNPQQKAIIVSGFSETERVKKALELGAGSYVRKPYLMEKIGVAIRTELLKATPGA